jgi:hypothetical protein
MPKTEIDYSNTIIYKITCKNPAITDVYVGHTTNFVQRKHAHKQSCINEKAVNYKCKVYEVIRNNGGWTNWKMEIINFFDCADHYAARKKEQEYFIALNATLNSIEPFPKPKVFIKNNIIVSQHKPLFNCETCHITCNDSTSFEKHQNTNKHKKLSQNGVNHGKCLNFSCETCLFKCSKKSNYAKHLTTTKHTNLNTKNTKTTKKFHCEKCDFNCSKNSYWQRHIITAKHIKLTNVNDNVSPTLDITFICNKCDKIYKSRVGLWKHSKKCKEVNNPTPTKEHSENEIKILTNLVMELVKSNTDLQKQIIFNYA